MDQIKKIIKEVTGIDVNNATRRRDVVEARALYFKLVKDKYNYTLQEIGNSVNKDHATVIHALNNVDMWMRFNQDLFNKYLDCLKMLDIAVFDETPTFFQLENIKLKEHIATLNETIEELKKLRDEIKRKYKQSKVETVLFDLEQLKKERLELEAD